MGRPKYEYVLLDFPADHEIAFGVPTEADMVYALLTNRGLRSSTVRYKITSRDTFEALLKRSQPAYKAVSFVHISGHANQDGVGLLGEYASWEEVGTLIRRLVEPVSVAQKRVLCLSTCSSKYGFEKLQAAQPNLFTGCYHLGRKKVDFHDAAAIWAMFYRTRKVSNPNSAITKAINDYLMATKAKTRLTYSSW